MLKSPRY